MFPKNQSDVEYPDAAKHSGTRKDGRNLVQEWTDRMQNKVSFSSSLWCFSAPPFLIPITFVIHNIRTLDVQSDDTVNICTILYICVFFFFPNYAERPLCLEQEAALITES